MKKFTVSALLALGLIALTHQSASAWVNSRFRIGLSWDRSAGGNSFFWGLYRNGQIPGPPPDGQGYGGNSYGAPPYGASYGAPYGAPQGYAPGPFDFAPAPQGLPPQGTMEPPIGGVPLSGTPYSSPFQFATNPRPTPTAPNGGR